MKKQILVAILAVTLIGPGVAFSNYTQPSGEDYAEWDLKGTLTVPTWDYSPEEYQPPLYPWEFREFGEFGEAKASFDMAWCCFLIYQRIRIQGRRTRSASYYQTHFREKVIRAEFPRLKGQKVEKKEEFPR